MTTHRLTQRDNLIRTLRGERPAWVPCCLNIDQWFGHRRTTGSLPTELIGCRDHIDAHARLGSDIFTRNFDGGLRWRDTSPLARTETSIEERSIGRRTITTVITPHGTLRSVWQEQRAISTSHQEEYLVKDWEQDGRAFRWWFDQREPYWDPDPFLAVTKRIGDRGIANLPMGETPLKFLHQHVGLDTSCLFIADFPDEAAAVCRDHWQKLRKVILQMADHPQVCSGILMDNVDTPFYPPRLAAKFWSPYVADATEIMRQRDKFLFVHACGKLAGLAALFAETKVTGLEGISHHPLGDWDARRAVDCHDRFVFVGGFSPADQVMDIDALRRRTDDLLTDMPTERTIFASSCNTEIGTSFAKIQQVMEQVRAWGGRPGLS